MKVFIIKGKNLCEKLLLKLNNWLGIITNNLSATFAITYNESFTVLWRNFGPLIFAELLSFNHIGGFSSMNCLLKVTPQHLNRIQVRTLTRPLQSLFVFLQPFRGGLAGEF